MADDRARLPKLRAYGILDTPPEPRFDDIARLACVICRTSVAALGFADADRHWYKARVGVPESELAWDAAVCSFVVEHDLDALVVDDLTADLRFRTNSFVVNSGSRFYAGVALRAPGGEMIGTLCVVDPEARPGGLTPEQLTGLHALARHAMALVWARTLIVDVPKPR